MVQVTGALELELPATILHRRVVTNVQVLMNPEKFQSRACVNKCRR